MDIIAKLFGRNKPAAPVLDDISLSRSEVMRHALTYSESMLAKRFKPDNAQKVVFETCCSNIIDMILELKKHNATMLRGEGIKPMDAMYEFKNVNLDMFFTDPKKNTYINQDAYREFHVQATIFCEEVHKCTLVEYGRMEHNYRTLRPVIHSVTQICNAIGKAIN